MTYYKFATKYLIAAHILLLSSCSSIESTFDSTLDTITEAGDYIYDSVNFWEDDEPEQSDAIIIEEAVEVPDYAMPQENFQEIAPLKGGFSSPQNQTQTFYDPIYRSQRQYYFVGPNGTPLLAPPPPPFPQYSIDQVVPMVPYSYNNNYYMPPQNQSNQNSLRNNIQPLPKKNLPKMLTEEEEMELFGIQNNCIRVTKDYVNGGYSCDDFD